MAKNHKKMYRIRGTRRLSHCKLRRIFYKKHIVRTMRKAMLQNCAVKNDSYTREHFLGKGLLPTVTIHEYMVVVHFTVNNDRRGRCLLLSLPVKQMYQVNKDREQRCKQPSLQRPRGHQPEVN